MTEPERDGLALILHLEPHAPDTFVGSGPRYPWGSLYGGQIVAQALAAAAATVEAGFDVHSLSAYFIRRGDQDEPVRYEVERLRNGRSFVTRQVVARQAVGAILNLSASFQQPEESSELSPVPAPSGLPDPETLEDDSWTPIFRRRWITGLAGDELGAWLRLRRPIGDDLLAQAAALAYLSDDLPMDVVARQNPDFGIPLGLEWNEATVSASLDHKIWFHRRLRAEDWHVHLFRCHRFTSGRGLAIGHVFDQEGSHAATVAQEVVIRHRR